MSDTTCVIYNPHAGRGKARKAIEAAKATFAPTAELWPTEYSGHGAALAEKAAVQGFHRVIAAGGDGTVHEVINGLLKSPGVTPTFCVWPLGSMNDLAYTLGILPWWKLKDKPVLETIVVDIGRAYTGTKSQYFINGCGIGFNGMVTIESRKIRWLRGLPLYTLGFLKAVFKHFKAPPLRLDWGQGFEVSRTFALSLCLGQREGGFPLGKEAVLDDGLFHYLHVKDVKRWELVRYLPNLITGNLPKSHTKMIMGQINKLKVESDTPLCVHLDGEFFALPEDEIKTVSVEILPKRLTVEVYRPALYGGR